MYHVSGITASALLMELFAAVKAGEMRVLKVSIEGEKLIPAATCVVEQDFKNDYESYIEALIEASIPCYILFRLDTKTSLGFDWMLISWVPEIANIRDKVLHASTKATLKIQFNPVLIREEMFATSLEDITFENYQLNKRILAPPEIKISEQSNMPTSTGRVNVNARPPSALDLRIPVCSSAIAAINDLAEGFYNYLQFNIDLKNTFVLLTKAGFVDLADLPNYAPNDHGRFHLYLYKYTRDETSYEAHIFIYSMPISGVSVKERMLYTSYKGAFEDIVRELGVDIRKKIEIYSGAELTEASILHELNARQAVRSKNLVRRSSRCIFPSQHQA